ncbi:MAG: hypothetical protein HUU55_01720 [Myxococcales bacterium]|nr:hypothetical protein [Myxococcales bacterium]
MMIRTNIRITLLLVALVSGMAVTMAVKQPACKKIEPTDPICVNAAQDCGPTPQGVCPGSWTCSQLAECEWKCDEAPQCITPSSVCGGGPLVSPVPIFIPQCPDGEVCQCVPSCPLCKDCGKTVCVAPEAGPIYQCGPGGICKAPDEKCACVPSCPECDDCAASVCVKCTTPNPSCPVFAPPAPGFCQNGVIVPQTSKDGCVLPPKCITECAEIQNEYSTLLTNATSCKSNADCSASMLVGLTCQCPATVNLDNTNGELMTALSLYWSSYCIPPGGGCGAGCANIQLNLCTNGVCGP